MTAGRKPGGTNRSSRIKITLQARFLEVLEKDFQEHGLAVVHIVRTEQPTQYLKIIASVLPQELLIQEGVLEQMSDEELLQALATIKQLRSGPRESGEKQQPAPSGAPESSKLH